MQSKKLFKLKDNFRIVHIVLALYVLVSASISLSAESNTAPTQSLPSKLSVVSTTGLLKDALINIAGDNIQVESLMGPGVDPHLYKATHSDLLKLRNAKLIVYNGLHLEGKMSEVLEKLSKSKPCLAVGASLDLKELLYSADAGGQPDPHIWFDVNLWTKAISSITAELVKLDPLNADYYQNNFTAYKERLEQLNLWITKEISQIPKEQRLLLTAHDAFGYFGRAYDIEVRGLQGISTASDFGLYDLKELVDLVVTRKIKAVFVESSVPQKFINSLIAGASARGANVKMGGELFSDALGAENTSEGTYLGMVTHNVNTIVKALK